MRDELEEKLGKGEEMRSESETCEDWQSEV